MPGAVITQPAAADGAPASEAPSVTNPFVRAALEHTEQFHDKNHGTITASAQAEGPIDVAPFGFVRGIILKVTASGAAGAATLADDGPWNVLQNISVQDVNGRPIFGPVDGYDLYLANLLGGYRHNGDPTAVPGYSAHSTGNFTFYLRIPLEITSQNALGALPNMNSAATYKLHYTLAAEATVWSSAPATTSAAIQVEAWLEAWSQPLPVDTHGIPNAQTPLGMGTTQYWSKSQINVNSGEQRLKLTRLGNLMRQIVFIFRNDASPSVRISTEYPTDLRLEFEQRIVHNVERQLFDNLYYEHTGVSVPTGVLVWDFTHEMGRAGHENRNLYLPTTQASRVELVGSFGGAGTLTVLTNDVAPAPVASAA